MADTGFVTKLVPGGGSTAADELTENPYLSEMILTLLSMKDILMARQACVAWYELSNSSPKLQRKLFLKAEPQRDILVSANIHWCDFVEVEYFIPSLVQLPENLEDTEKVPAHVAHPLVTYADQDWLFDSVNLYNTPRAGPELGRLLRQENSSLQAMFVTQPPVDHVIVHFNIRNYQAQRHALPVSRPDGVKWSDIAQAICRVERKDWDNGLGCIMHRLVFNHVKKVYVYHETSMSEEKRMCNTCGRSLQVPHANHA